MTAKEYLRQIRTLDKRIGNLRRELESLRSDAYSVPGIRYDKEVVQGGRRHDPMADMVSKFEDKARELDRTAGEYIELRSRIVEQINALDDPVHIELLYLRYIDGLTFEQIAAAMHYTERWTQILHGRALQSFTSKFINSL